MSMYTQLIPENFPQASPEELRELRQLLLSKTAIKTAPVPKAAPAEKPVKSPEPRREATVPVLDMINEIAADLAPAPKAEPAKAPAPAPVVEKPAPKTAPAEPIVHKTEVAAAAPHPVEDLNKFLNPALARSMAYVKEQGLDLPIQINDLGGHSYLAKPCDVVNIQKGRRRVKKQTARVWIDLQTGNLVNLKKMKELDNSCYQEQQQDLRKQGLAAKLADELADEAALQRLIPLATFLEAWDKGENWVLEDRQELRKQIEAAKAEIATPASGSATETGDTKTAAPANDEAVAAPTPENPAPANSESKAKVIPKKPIDPLKLIRGASFGNERMPLTKQVEILRESGYDLPYHTRCFSETEPKGLTFSIKPSETIFVADDWHLNSWVKADSKLADLKHGRQAPLTPVDYQMVATLIDEEYERVMDILHSRGFKEDEKLAFEGVPPERQETVRAFACRVAKNKWIPTVNFLMASLKGDYHYAKRVERNESKLGDIEVMPKVEIPEPAVEPQSQPAPETSLQPELPLPQDSSAESAQTDSPEPEVTEITDSESAPAETEEEQIPAELTELHQQMRQDEEAAGIADSPAPADEQAALAEAVNADPAGSEHAGNGGSGEQPHAEGTFKLGDHPGVRKLL